MLSQAHNERNLGATFQLTIQSMVCRTKRKHPTTMYPPNRWMSTESDVAPMELLPMQR